MAGKFEGMAVLVTGGARGIGLASARAFAAHGASVMLADLDLDVAEERAQDIRSTGARAAAVQVDVADYEACEAMVARTVEEFGGLHVAFNNAGIASAIVSVEDCAVEDWRRVIDVNVMGTFHCLKAEVPAMKAAGGSAIVITASIMSHIVNSGMSAYAASKHAVAGLTKSVALDLIGYGIRVNAVCPGFTHTSMLDPAQMTPEMNQQVADMTPIGRIAKAEEIADAVLYLASNEASYIVGQLLTVDGGVILR